METISEKTERVEHSLTFKELYQGLVTCKKVYTCHKFQVFNDQFHWANSNCDQTSEIDYMDFLDDLSQQYKYEPQSCHFSKQQYSLSCTVKHTCCENYPHEYFYHLSGDMRHNFAFTLSVVYHSLQLNSPSVTCFKYDNCLTQYKSKYVFKKWQALATKTKKLVIVYYGVSGHGKVLVETVSGFAVKGPLQKAVKTSNFSYSYAVDIYNFLIKKFSNYVKKHYFLLNPEHIKCKEKLPLSIKSCMEKHMIAFFQMVQSKQKLICVHATNVLKEIL